MERWDKCATATLAAELACDDLVEALWVWWLCSHETHRLTDRDRKQREGERLILARVVDVGVEVGELVKYRPLNRPCDPLGLLRGQVDSVQHDLERRHASPPGRRWSAVVSSSSRRWSSERRQCRWSSSSPGR